MTTTDAAFDEYRGGPPSPLNLISFPKHHVCVFKAPRSDLDSLDWLNGYSNTSEREHNIAWFAELSLDKVFANGTVLRRGQAVGGGAEARSVVAVCR